MEKFGSQSMTQFFVYFRFLPRPLLFILLLALGTGVYLN